MTQKEMFGGALWLAAGPYSAATNTNEDPSGTPLFPILRAHFSVSSPDRVVLRAVGLGFFHAYVNGVEVTRARFLPLSTDYEARAAYPIDEELHGHRLIVPERTSIRNRGHDECHDDCLQSGRQSHRVFSFL